MTDFRALCAELADSVELLLEMRAVDAKPMAITEDRFFRARAALAQPEPQGPTVADHGAVCTGCDTPRHEEISIIAAGSIACCPDCSTLTVLDRNAIRKVAALAQPKPQGPTDEELWSMYQEEARDFSPVAYARAILQRWGRPAIEPVPQQGE